MRKLVTVQKIDNIENIPNADKIELATIKGWKVVVQKGDYKVGDVVLYYEIDSFLPNIPEYNFLLNGSSLKRMLVDGVVKEGIRLRTKKLRGQISQGLVMPLTTFGVIIVPEIDTDVSEILGVTKYEPPIAANLTGVIKGSFPWFIPKTDEERIQNFPNILRQNVKNFYVTEKLDGCSVTYYKKDGVLGVCSRNLEMKEGDTAQWIFAKEHKLSETLPENFAIQGEIVGEGIQSNPLKITGHDVYFFNVYDIENNKYLDYEDFVNFLNNLELKHVPVVNEMEELPEHVGTILTYADAKSAINPNVNREGIVIRPKKEQQYKNGRFSFKAISNLYLLNDEK